MALARIPEDGYEFLEDAEDAGDEDVGDDRVADGSHVVGHQRLDALAHLRRIQSWLSKQNRPRSLNDNENESDSAHPVEGGRDEVRDVHDVGVEFGDGLRDLTEGPRPPGLHVVQQVVDQGREVRLEQVKERLKDGKKISCISG